MAERLRALVTGASGYVGSHVVRALASGGWEVAALTRRHVASDGERDATGVAMFTADGSFESVRLAVEKVRPTVVFHLAANTTAVPRADDVDPMLRSNVLLLAHLAEAVRLANTPCLVNTGTYWQFAPDGSARPNTLYAATKQAAESILDLHASRGLRVATLILHDVYGPADPRPKLLGQLAAVDPGAAPIDLSAGTQTVDYVYVDDAARAFVCAADWLRAKTSAGHERFVVRGQRPLTLREVVGLLAAARGVTLPIRWGLRPASDHDIHDPWLGGTPVPGWKPQVSLEQGLLRMVKTAERL